MHRRRREDGEMDLVSPQRQDEEERDRGVLLHHLQVARRPRQMPRQGDEGSAARQDDEPEGDAVRRQAHDLWRGQGDRGGVTPDVSPPALPSAFLLLPQGPYPPLRERYPLPRQAPQPAG